MIEDNALVIEGEILSSSGQAQGIAAQARGGHNHWLDCLVGCAAAASMQGVERIGTGINPQPDRERLELSELRRQRC